VAPEILNGDYDEKCDLWSCGIIMHCMLIGKPPFLGRTDQDIYKKIMDSPFVMNEKEWKGISNDAKTLIKKLLDKNPKTRFSA
jgi:calcium-dependent protein kinase